MSVLDLGGKVGARGVGLDPFSRETFDLPERMYWRLQPKNVTVLRFSVYVGMGDMRHHHVLMLLVYRKRHSACEVSITQRRRVMNANYNICVTSHLDCVAP
jgi:hypothetical protein